MTGIMSLRVPEDCTHPSLDNFRNMGNGVYAANEKEYIDECILSTLALAGIDVRDIRRAPKQASWGEAKWGQASWPVDEDFPEYKD